MPENWKKYLLIKNLKWARNGQSIVFGLRKNSKDFCLRRIHRILIWGINQTKRTIFPLQNTLKLVSNSWEMNQLFRSWSSLTMPQKRKLTEWHILKWTPSNKLCKQHPHEIMEIALLHCSYKDQINVSIHQLNQLISLGIPLTDSKHMKNHPEELQLTSKI